MKYAPRVLVGAASIAFTVVAAAAPVTIDSEQKATMAVNTAVTVVQDASNYHGYLMQEIRRNASRALQLANAVTTPAALMSSPSGVTAPCEVSGSMTARMAPRQPRVLKFEFHDCHYLAFGWPYSLDGPGELVLLSDSLAPTATVGSIRFGNGQTDLVQTRDLSFPDQVSHDVYRRNLRIVGLIPLSEFQAAGSEVNFAYVFTGLVDEAYHSEHPVSGRAPSSFTFNYLLDNVTYAGVNGTLPDWSGNYEDLRVLFGKLVFTRHEQEPYGTSVDSEEYFGLRVQSRYDYIGLTHDWSIDGRVNKVFNRWFGAGCVNGDYTFKTSVPMRYSLTNYQLFSTGDLTINGSTRARFYTGANVPAGLPAPVNGLMLNLDVRNAGVFNYDSPSPLDAIRDIAQCM